MKRALLPLLALLAACAVPPEAPSEAAEATARASLKADPAPDASVAAVASETASQGNTYDMTCGPVRARFDAAPLPESMRARLSDAQTWNAREGGVLADGSTPVAKVQPMPDLSLIGTERISVVCDVIFDLDAAGVPQAIAPRCSDARYDAAAASALKAARFEPVMKDRRAVAHKGIIYPLEFCFND